jgi:hypothetical protein
MATSDFESANNFSAFAACGFVSFIWSRMAPTISTGEKPPIILANVPPAPALLALDVE